MTECDEWGTAMTTCGHLDQIQDVAADSTEGPEKPLGARGARMADNVGPAKHGSVLPGWLAGRLHRR